MGAIKITMYDVRAAEGCSTGARLFFKRYGFDWSDFLKNGIDIEKIEPIDNAVSKRICKQVREKHGKLT